MYQQQKQYNTAMDRFSKFKLDMASQLKRERAGVALEASSCNAFAIATFSTFLYFFEAVHRNCCLTSGTKFS